MKKVILLLSICAALIVCSCDNSSSFTVITNSDLTEESAESLNEEPFVLPTAEADIGGNNTASITELVEGKAYSADMDGDGKPEQITFADHAEKEEALLIIVKGDGTQINLPEYGSSPDAHLIKTAGGQTFVELGFLGADIGHTYVYKMSENTLEVVFYTSGRITEISGDVVRISAIYIDMIGEYWATCEYKVADDTALVPSGERLVILTDNTEWIETSRTLNVLILKDGEYMETELNTGTKIILTAVDNDRDFVLFKLEDDRTGKILVTYDEHNGYVIEGKPAEEFFISLPYVVFCG